MSEKLPPVWLTDYDLCEESGDVTILMPGMLYDTIDPPSKSVLHNLKTELGAEIAFMEYAATNNNSGLYYQAPIDDLAGTVLAELERLDQIKQLRKASIISHSVGALVAAKIIDSIGAYDFFKPVVFLSPPPTFPIVSAALEIKHCITDLIDPPRTQSIGGIKTDLFRGDSGKTFAVSDKVWTNIFPAAELYELLASGVQNSFDVLVVMGRLDRVFDPIEVQRSFGNFETVFLDDTHSLKKPDSVKIVADMFRRMRREV